MSFIILAQVTPKQTPQSFIKAAYSVANKNYVKAISKAFNIKPLYKQQM